MHYSQLGQDMFALAATNHKRSGFFLDIGAGFPRHISNTFLLETQYGWTGIGFDIQEQSETDGGTWAQLRPNTKLVIADIFHLNIKDVLDANHAPKVIDFLSVALEPPELTLECLCKKIPFNKYKFKCLCFETDEYRPGGIERREKSRKFLAALGYKLVHTANLQDDYYIFEGKASMTFKRAMSGAFRRSGHLLGRIASRISNSPPIRIDPCSLEPPQPTPAELLHRASYARWVTDKGETLRRDYDLGQESLVFDLGGYEGQWTSDLFSIYRCTIHVFEPVHAFANQIRQRLSRNERITVHQFGLGGLTKRVRIGVCENGSSVFKESALSEEIQLVQAAEFLRENEIKTIDLMKINIEGGEYDLLEHLIDTAVVRQIRNIQVQFHLFVPKAELRMRAIQDALAKTHRVTWQYPFVWENWRVKEDV